MVKELNEYNEKREINGLISALESFKLKDGIIITENEEKEEKINKKNVKFIPLWKWFLI